MARRPPCHPARLRGAMLGVLLLGMLATRCAQAQDLQAVICPPNASSTTAGNEAVDRSSHDSGSAMSLVTEYTTSAPGPIQVWELFSIRPVSIHLQFWRHSGGRIYALVGQNIVGVVSGYNRIEVPVTEQFEVAAGDVIGWYMDGIQSLPFTESDTGLVRRVYGAGGLANPIDMSGDLTGWNRNYSIRAETGCACFAGYSNATSECVAMDCPANTTGTNLATGCDCNFGFSGSVVRSHVAPLYYEGHCAATACPMHSTGADVASGCTCDFGWAGSIQRVQHAPYFTGVCVELIPPTIHNCSSLDIVGTTIPGEPYATMGSLQNALPDWTPPTAVDDDGASLAVTARVASGMTEIHPSTRFRFDRITTIRFEATDSAGLLSFCETSVTVIDNEAPVLQDCTYLDVSGTTDDGAAYGTIQTGSVTLAYPSVVDNSGEAIVPVASIGGSTVVEGTIVINGAVWQASRFPLGRLTTLTYTVVDAAGNSDSCQISVSIADDEPPSLQSCDGLDIDGTTDLGFSYGTIEAGSLELAIPLASDNSGLPVTVSPSVYGAPVSRDHPFPYDSVTILTYIATDNAGLTSTCDVSVTIIDDQPPLLRGCLVHEGITGNTSTGQSFGTTDSGSVVLVYPTAVDNLSGDNLPVVASIDAGMEVQGSTPFPYASVTLVTFTATGISGHSASCDITVTVVDIEPPVLSNCHDIVGHCDAGRRYGTAAAGSFVLDKPPATDNSGEIMRVTGYLGGGVRVYSTTKFAYDRVRTVRFEATDSSDLTAFCEITVTVTDTEPPELQNCTGLDVSGKTDDGGEHGTIRAGSVRLVYPGATDNSGELLTPVASVDGSAVTPGTLFPHGSVTTLTYTVTDRAGLSVSCQITVSIRMSRSPRYSMALSADIAVLEEDEVAKAEFETNFKEALAVAIGNIDPSRIIVTSIVAAVIRRQMQSGNETSPSGGVLVEFYVEPAPDGATGDDPSTSTTSTEPSPAAAIGLLSAAGSSGDLEAALASEASLVLVAGSFGETAIDPASAALNQGPRTLTVAYRPDDDGDGSTCFVENSGSSVALKKPVFNFPRGMVSANGWIYIVDANVLSRMPSESSKHEATGSPQKMVGDRSKGNSDGTYTAGRFYHPGSLAMATHPETGKQMLFIADTGNDCVRVVDVLHRISRTIAGGSQLATNDQTAALKYPRGLAVIKSSQVSTALEPDTWQVLVSDQNRIVRLTFTWDQLFTTTMAEPAAAADVMAGSLQRGTADGPGAVARFSRPHGLQLLERFDGKGNSQLELYIADFGNHKVRRMIVSTNLVTTVLEIGVHFPRGLTLDPGKFQVGNHGVH